MSAELPLFAYGSLTDPRVRERLLGRRHDLEAVRARLPGYTRVTVPDFSYPLAAPAAPTSLLDGVLITGLTAADYERLDEYEDVPAGRYERVIVEVEMLGCGSSQLARAWLYAAGPRSGIRR